MEKEIAMVIDENTNHNEAEMNNTTVVARQLKWQYFSKILKCYSYKLSSTTTYYTVLIHEAYSLASLESKKEGTPGVWKSFRSGEFTDSRPSRKILYRLISQQYIWLVLPFNKVIYTYRRPYYPASQVYGAGHFYSSTPNEDATAIQYSYKMENIFASFEIQHSICSNMIKKIQESLSNMHFSVYTEHQMGTLWSCLKMMIYRGDIPSFVNLKEIINLQIQHCSISVTYWG